MFVVVFLVTCSVCLSLRPIHTAYRNKLFLPQSRFVPNGRFSRETSIYDAERYDMDKPDDKLNYASGGNEDGMGEGKGMYSKGLLSDPTIDTGVMIGMLEKIEYTDEEYDEFLEAMIYGGDINGFIQRRAKEVVSDDFLDFVQYKIEEECDDEEEKDVLREIIALIEEKLRQTDGLGKDGEMIFEMRLDKLLFAPPNVRKKFIQDNLNDYTPGFIEYVQKELTAAPDTDSKVVLASVLQLIGQVKDTNLIQDGDSSLLSMADSSLGDQFAQEEPSGNIGSGLIMDGGDLSGAVKAAKNLNVDKSIGDKMEQILASLMFSQNDVLEDVLNNLHEINDQFVTHLQDKIEKTQDVEERVGLTSLLQTVSTVLQRVKDVEGEEERSTKDEELTMDQVKERVKEMQRGVEEEEAEKEAEMFGEAFEVQDNSRETFLSILKRFEDAPEGMPLLEQVELNYHLCDYQFMNLLKKEAEDCIREGAVIEAQQYQDLLDTISRCMKNKITTAQSKFERILARKDPGMMLAEVTAMTRKGEVDEALTLLIEANAQQAEQAGNKQVADLLVTMGVRIQEERERSLPDEQRLLRALLRLDTKQKRINLMVDAFEPTSIVNQDGTKGEGPPMITPPLFINIVKTFIEQFGNVEKFKIMEKATEIIDEAEEVASELYGESMTPREQQKMVFEKRTVSVWDLADFEDKALMSGEEVPWRNDAFDDKLPEDVLGDRVKQANSISDGMTDDDMGMPNMPGGM